MASELTVLFERLLPEVLDPLLNHALAGGVRRSGDQGLHRVCASGRFSGPQTADLLAFCRSQELSGALVVAEPDELRVLYFRLGRVIAADSSMLFERLGRILLREGILTKADADTIVECEEQQGLEVAVAALPPEAARFALERRIWEVAISLYFTRNAHFLIVEGEPELGDLPVTPIPPDRLAMEGMRRYDEWRNTTRPTPPGAASAAGSGSAARPTTAASRVSA